MKLKDAISAQPNPPCDQVEERVNQQGHLVRDHIKCPNYERCAAEALACSAFSKYVSNQTSRRIRWFGEEPNAEIFARIYEKDGA